MDQEFKSKWCAALRSGEYKQGEGRLRRGNTFCCLGVAADLIDPDAWYEEKGGFLWRGTGSYGTCNYLPLVEAEKIGLEGEIQDILGEKNDRGYDFIRVADWIEANL